MADNDDENFFSDDDFDDLPADTLHELEQRAFLSTQQTKAAAAAVVIPHDWHQQNKRNGQPQSGSDRNSVGAQRYPEPPSSDYGFDEEDVIDLDEPSIVVQPGQGVRTTRCVSPIEQAKHLGQPQVTTGIQQFPAVQDVLRKSAEDARNAALVKAGETAITRANLDKTTKEYERKIHVMKKLYEEEIGKQKTELDVARKDREKVETNNRFLEHDLAQEVERAKRSRGTLTDGTADARKASGTGQPGPAGTPKKGKGLPFRDGFEDDEIFMPSPSKSRDKSRSATPVGGAKKRKRTVNDSPAPLLQLCQPGVVAEAEEASEPPTDGSGRELLAKIGREEERFNFMQRVLNHRPRAGHDRTVEALAKYAFPSAPSEPLSSLIFDRLSPLFAQGASEGYDLDFCNVLLDWWSQCLEESYHAPLYLIFDLISLVFSLSPNATATSTIPTLLPLATETADLVAVPIARASTTHGYRHSTDEKSFVKMRQDVDVYEVLNLLYTVALGCFPKKEELKQFWQNMEYDFVMVMLNKAQPLDQVVLTLQLVSTSPLEDSFGAVNGDKERQMRNERAMIERLVVLLYEHPEAAADEEPYEEEEIMELCIEALNVLRSLCLTPHGGRALATHPICFGRLVRFLCDAITNLYCQLPTHFIHSLTIQSINLSMRLVHHLATKFPNEVNIREKMSVIYGGHQKFIMALTRLAFSETLCFEEGIEEEVVDAAHEILDGFLSPEEGEALLGAFSSPRGGTRPATAE
ncbi:hypothetical protein BJ546DRAFT_849393 [Cryomyces antarcticus]